MMINFKKNVIELLKFKSAINLPNFGCFITVNYPSVKKNSKILPPSKKVVFRNDYKDEEDYLTPYISSKEKISYSKAIHEIQHEINLIKEYVLENNSYLFDDLGEFYLTTKGDIEFKFNEDINLNLKSYGLKPI